jgi:SRSO17 transposase
MAIEVASVGFGPEMDALGHFCGDIFATLARVDQRRAAESYVYGLLTCAGRKSIRRLAATVPNHSEQSLQQFVNQSPWDPNPIRQRLLGHLIRELQPLAWLIEEVHFPKHGYYSAAVERQYVRSLSRVRNCQLAITVTLTTDRYTIPVNWRLVVPDSWGRDKERRVRARMPDHELPRPYWQYHIEVLDDMALEWGMPAAPVAVDATNRDHVDAFLRALEIRHQPYVAHVSPALKVCADPVAVHMSRGIGRPAYLPPTGQRTSWHGTADELIHKAAGFARETVEWREDDEGRVLRSQFLRIPVHGLPSEGGQDFRNPAAAPAAPPPRLLLSEWPLGKPHPRGFWLTNIVDRPLSKLVELAKLGTLANQRIELFADQYGLRDYEGRTFAGWHHHVTLATAAYAYTVLNKCRINSPQPGRGDDKVGDQNTQ